MVVVARVLRERNCCPVAGGFDPSIANYNHDGRRRKSQVRHTVSSFRPCRGFRPLLVPAIVAVSVHRQCTRNLA